MAASETYSWRSWLPSVVIASALAVSGCSDDGSDGAAGPTGPVGPNVIVKSEISATMVASIDSATVAGDGALTVIFSLEDDRGNGFVGLDAKDISFTAAQLIAAGGTGGGDASRWQSYINKMEQPGVGPGTVAQLQATSEKATGTSAADEDRFTDHGDGSYSYTLSHNLKQISTASGEPFDVAYNPALIHRVGFQLGKSYPAANPVFDWKPSGEAIDPESEGRKIVAKDACNSCHGVLAIHGGTRVETDYCVTCHNPGTTDANSGNTVDFKQMIHKIHSGANLPTVASAVEADMNAFNTDNPGASRSEKAEAERAAQLEHGYVIYGYRDAKHSFGAVGFPQDIRNCKVCHDESDLDEAPQAPNWRTQPTMEACGSCHDDVNFATGEGHGNATFAGGAQLDNVGCQGCHGETAVNAPTDSRHTGVMTRKEELRTKFVVTVESVNVKDQVAGTVDVVVSMSLDSGAGPVAVTDLSDPDGAGPKLTGGYLVINWATDDSGYQVNNKKISLTGCEKDTPTAGLFTCRADWLDGIGDDDTITVTTLGLSLCFNEKDGAILACNTAASDLIRVGKVDITPNPAYFKGKLGLATVADGVAYDKVGADLKSCQSCHGDKQFHYAATELLQCKTCHNATKAASSGRPGDLKRHVHRKHSTLDSDPLDVNDPDEEAQVDLFPAKVDNCNACHTPVDTRNGIAAQYDLPLQQNSRASWANRGGEVFISPTAVVCGSCHISTALGKIDLSLEGYSATPLSAAQQEVVNHMVINGAVFGALVETGLTGATGKESCSVCHAVDREFGVNTVHSLIQ